MYSFLKLSAATVAGWVMFSGSALANPTGCGFGQVCQVPEPGTWALVGIAIAGVAIASKFGKRK